VKLPAAAQAFADSLNPTDRFAFVVGYQLGQTGSLPPPIALDELRRRLGLRTVNLYCDDCGRGFPRTGKRGHPAKRCNDCRGVAETA
jgi:hypothetical protein